ncbi:regulator of G-protein signaling 22 [Solea solea]|uniref:regulator of G-protein signaling 22 n=1 Tax=Solea solea TaxID=90069 RepID=UPI00272CF133|nr:regulator of G-protein signaling 22 [Solea solea]XP_058503201.1 regulator of G-protein signaling 22 [Solea solea]
MIIIMCGAVSKEFPILTDDNFEHTLVSDDILDHFFNDFLSMPCFSEALLHNQETGLFEVVSGAAETISRRIRSVLQHSKSQLLTGDPSMLTITPVDNEYTVCCLDVKQGIEWIMRERLPFFLKSDCYTEYRLAKLLCQWEPTLCVQRMKSSSHSLENISSKQETMTKNNVTYLLSDHKEHTKYRKSSRCISSCSEADNSRSLSSQSVPCSSFSNHKRDETQELQSPQMGLHVSFTEPPAGSSEMHYLEESMSQSCESSELQLENVSDREVKQMLNNALNIMDDQSEGNISDCFNKPGEQTSCTSKEKRCECKERLKRNREEVEADKWGSGAEKNTEWDENTEERCWDTDQENVCDICCPGTCCHDNKPGLDEFKEFLQGTPGEKLLSLWMDIEKLKALQHGERKNRYLVLMRCRYLLSSSHSSLNTELLSRLGLITSPCWSEENLRLVQPCLTEALLYYWAPRFWRSQEVQDDHDDDLWTEWWNCPLQDRRPQSDSLTESFSHPDASVPQSSTTDPTQILEEKRLENMLQALCVDSRAGSYFTHFCEQSQNQLWENAVYFWTDLQHYHELFYQDGLDPYRVRRQAQLLYSTYLSTSAKRSVGVDEEIRKEVYERLIPAYEELFDKAEEHILDILLQPWMLLVSRDKESFQQVRMHERVHTVDSQEYRELQSMLKESERLKQCNSAASANHSKDDLSDSWSKVSPNYQGYGLASLLRLRHEIGHFMSFLDDQDASVHLTCWLDLERYKRTRPKDKTVNRERSSHIAAKYLNRKYFFGPESPASTEQQDEIFHMVGGMDNLKPECLSDLVIAEIQDIVKNHLEKTWLPKFLSTGEFVERQRQKPQLRSSTGKRSQYVPRRSRRRRKHWKVDSWMSSSKEILQFRQFLLNPVTCTQFQHYVSLKGDFLENDLLFWLEVQRYKDLSHSHSEETTIQQKITTIISCFINSSMNPKLRIDISPEQAQYILEKRHEIGPYIFREAQLSVFNELLKFWPKFQELSKTVREEQLLPLLQAKRAKHKNRLRRQRRKEEEEEQEEEEEERRRKAHEEWEKQESDNSGSDSDTGEAKSDWKTWSKQLMAPKQPLSWSYSKYVAALKQEEVQLSKTPPETSFSTISDDSSFYSARSAESDVRRSHRSSRADSKQCNMHNRR